jgi:arylsulfatase A-like enzyme
MNKGADMVKQILLAMLASGAVWAAPPNIVYINADDLGVMDVGFNNPKYNTPNIDRLRAEGMLFTDAYAPAANCAPSRACVMSGQVGPRHGVYTVGNSDRGNAKTRKIIPIKNTEHLDPEIMTLADALKAGGYETIHLGKWHAGDAPLQQGFDVNIGGNGSGSPTGGYFTPFKGGTMTGYNAKYPAGTHRVDIFADEAIKFMRANRARPMFVHMAYYSVHSKLEPVPEFVEKYKGKNVHAAYASMIEKMDQGIGRILDEIEALGLKDNTLVLFTSDNGGICKTSSQQPYRSGKGSYFEGGIREPMVVRWPARIQPNSSCSIPVIGIDFFPTFLDAAGLPTPENKILDGVSLLPLLTQSGPIAERTLFWHFPIYLQAYAGIEDDSHDALFRTRPGSALRQGKWKLHEYFEDGRLELYDLESDLGERSNLADRHPEKAQELRRLLEKWRAETNAPVPTEPNPKYDPNLKAKPKKGK